MSHKFISSAKFHLLLITIDQEIAKEVLQKGCIYCGNKLHKANYPRSPFGLLSQFRHHYDERFSLCCNACRKRTTPPSVRFFGRRWYPAPLFMLISALMLGINERRLRQVKQHFGITVSESTWKRWRRWWRDSFESTQFWQQNKGIAFTTIESIYRCPRALLVVFKGLLEEKMQLLLRFLSPLTGGILRAV
ncbi:MAG: hypothetical protein ACD_45C00484G0001 [uncultured bacterium]|nr:MAG: hypothetical protein ACD_45C00484G0001 [uncultured bacterium]